MLGILLFIPVSPEGFQNVVNEAKNIAYKVRHWIINMTSIFKVQFGIAIRSTNKIVFHESFLSNSIVTDVRLKLVYPLSMCL